MPRVSSPRPLDLTKPFVTSSQDYGSQPFDLSQGLVTWYRDIKGDFVPDLSGRGNTARAAGSGFQPVTSSFSVPELNASLYDIKSFGFGLGTTSTTVSHLTTISGSSSAAREDHSFTDGTKDLPFSISFWIRPDSISTTQYVITKYSGLLSDGLEWSVFVNTNDIYVYLYTSNSSNWIRAYSLDVVQSNSWQHFVITYDGSESYLGLLIYKNGVQASGFNQSANGSYTGMISSDVPLCVGSTFSSVSTNEFSTNRVLGNLHSIAVWKNRTLEAQEVNVLYSAYLNGTGGEVRSGFISKSPRLQLRELDDHPGSYPTVIRSGDATRKGRLKTSFDDTTSIVFAQNGISAFPAMLPKGSSFMLQAVDIAGQESDISASLPIRSFQQPNHLHYSPVEEMGPFDENRVLPATKFFTSGTNSEILPGFQSPMRSKFSFSIDVTPNSETVFTRNLSSRNTAEGQPVGPTNTGFMYYNFTRHEWEQIGANDPATGDPIYYDYDLSYYGMSVPSPSGTLPAQFSISPGTAYAPDDEKKTLGYSKIGTPISAFGAPNAEIYHATSSQCFRMSDAITRPFLLESVRVEFGEARAQRKQGDSYYGNPISELEGYEGLYSSGSLRDIDNYVFFMYRQSRKNRVIDSISDVSSSERSLILSGSMTFWNSSSFQSNEIRYENQEVNYSLAHSPAFSYEFGLPYGSTNNTRLTDWDPSHDTYKVNNIILDVTSQCVAHFNFENDASAGENVPDKSGNGHVATIGPVPIAGSVSGATLDPTETPGYPTSALLGDTFFDARAYITNRGYLVCLALDSVSPAMIIDHANDLQFTTGSPKSIAFWMNPIANPPSSDQWILSKADNSTGTQIEYFIQLDTSGRLVFRCYGTGGGYFQRRTTAALSTIYSNTGWYHITVTYSGTNTSPAAALQIYVNGKTVGLTSTSLGTFTAPVNLSQDVLVGGLGSTITAFSGFIGSLEFYSTLLTIGGKHRNLYLLQETPFLNRVQYATASFTGSIAMNLYPTVCNRQSFGVSRYRNGNLQNVWLGGTASKKFNKADWSTIFNSPANPFELLDAGAEGPIDNHKFSAQIDSRATKFYGRDSSDSQTTTLAQVAGTSFWNDDTEQSIVSPYLLMPHDELIFGIDAGICNVLLPEDGYSSHLTGSHLTISTKPCKVTLVGSFVQDGSESQVSLNQNLSSVSIHEIVGAEPIVDQYLIEPNSSYYGSYTSEIVTGSMAVLNNDGSTFTIYDQDNSRRVIRRLSS